MTSKQGRRERAIRILHEIRSHPMELIRFLVFAALMISSLVTWMFFFLASSAFVMALLDKPLSLDLQIMLTIGIFVNSVLFASMGAARIERIIWPIRYHGPLQGPRRRA